MKNKSAIKYGICKQALENKTTKVARRRLSIQQLEEMTRELSWKWVQQNAADRREHGEDTTSNGAQKNEETAQHS